MLSTYIIVWFIIAILSSAIPIPLLRIYYNTKDPIYIIIGCVLFIVLIYAYLVLLKTGNMSQVYPFVKISAILMVSMIGIIIYGEPLTKWKIFGLILGILAIWCLI